MEVMSMNNEPLAMKLRPTCIDDVIGQTHLVAPGKVLYNMIKNKKLFSMILYGKPGIGKTSIAHAMVKELGLKYRMLNAVINNKKDFDIVLENPWNKCSFRLACKKPFQGHCNSHRIILFLSSGAIYVFAVRQP